MKERALLFIALGLLLAACAPVLATATGTATAAPAAATPSAAAPTESPTLPPASTALASDVTGQPMPGCTLQTLLRPPDATEESLFPPVNAAEWQSGPGDAATTIVVYSDFQCPFCGQLTPVLAQLKADYPQELRIVFRQLPLFSIHDKAWLAALAAEAAGLQGKFWEMHDLLFARQAEWAPLSIDAFKPWLLERAGELDLAGEQFAADLDSEAIAAKIEAAYDSAVQSGVPGTPFLLVNGRIYTGPTDYHNLSVIIKLYALQERQYQTCPPMITDPARTYTATLFTNKGEIVIELLPENAPLAVNNFVFLALEGFYDGVSFHRVFPGYIAQTGDPSGTGFGGPGYAFVREDNGLSFDQAGLVAIDSVANGSQFFITYAPLPSLDGVYTIFGRVISGMEVLEALTARDPNAGINQPQGDLIETILISEN